MSCTTVWILLFIFHKVFVHSILSSLSNNDASVIDAIRFQWESKCLFSPMSNENSSSKSTILSKQTNLHNGCVAYYLHNHKTGGSSICHTALNSGYHITNLEDNCNLPKEIVNMENLKHGVAQHYVLSHPKLSFVAQEQPPFYPNISNDKYIYITTLRHPIDRVISHLHHGICVIRTLENAQKFLHNGNCSIQNIKDMTLSDLILDKCFDKELLWLSSNYYVSMFTGCINNRKKISTGVLEDVCSRRHLKIAQNKLHYFSVIMITDTLKDFDRYSKLLDLKLSMKFSHKYRLGTHENSKEKSNSLRRSNASAWNKLVSINSLDVEFFEYAKMLANTYLRRELHLLGDTEQRKLRSDKPSSPHEFGHESEQMSSKSDKLPFCNFPGESSV